MIDWDIVDIKLVKQKYTQKIEMIHVETQMD